MRQQLSLGHLLRKRYILGEPPFMSERYSPKEVWKKGFLKPNKKIIKK